MRIDLENDMLRAGCPFCDPPKDRATEPGYCDRCARVWFDAADIALGWGSLLFQFIEGQRAGAPFREALGDDFPDFAQRYSEFAFALAPQTVIVLQWDAEADLWNEIRFDEVTECRGVVQ